MKCATHRNQLGLDHLVNGQPLLRISLEAAFDQLLGLVGHLGPLRLGELKLAQADPLLHSRRHWKALQGVERREPTQPGEDFVSIGKLY